ncbi:cytochrome c3 family protein [Halomonas sp. KAO]|uniref:cytochrome c3 family protein n=1 Tax=Halomonas sp. KAO TaxID=2783858 RepID=UPI00189EF90E|nr:cytochrome c3 family protein [Halomonas sp. KAO]MBF7054598.1 cytochrome c3 family protein [Halomonas sp. KAO]
MISSQRLLFIGLLLALLAGAALLMLGQWQHAASPAPLSRGHAGLECADCHLDINSSQATLSIGCQGCHEEVLGEQRAHSPEYLSVVGRGDSPWHTRPDGCLDCHNGHVRAGDGFASALPADQCTLCHAGIITEHDYHLGLDFNSCASCHRYHDRVISRPRPAD